MLICQVRVAECPGCLIYPIMSLSCSENKTFHDLWFQR